MDRRVLEHLRSHPRFGRSDSYRPHLNGRFLTHLIPELGRWVSRDNSGLSGGRSAFVMKKIAQDERSSFCTRWCPPGGGFLFTPDLAPGRQHHRLRRAAIRPRAPSAARASILGSGTVATRKPELRASSNGPTKIRLEDCKKPARRLCDPPRKPRNPSRASFHADIEPIADGSSTLVV